MSGRPLFFAAAATIGMVLAAAVPASAKVDAAGQAFLANNAKQPGVVSLPGIQYKIVKSGLPTGKRPGKNDFVRVNYEGRLVTGEVFDSSYARGTPVEFPLSRLITGWGVALQMMRPGDEWIITIPPELGYGEEGQGQIPANAVLVFKVELLGVRQDSFRR
jgi:peptidylprolyl isomerase/FKBP-type peptidyl-prolyl cis-trans isomerase FklB